MPPTLTSREWRELQVALDRHLARCRAHHWLVSVDRTTDLIRQLDALKPAGQLPIAVYASLAPDAPDLTGRFAL